MMSSSWAPNETDYQIFQEKIWLQAGMLQNLPFGVELSLFVMCFLTSVQNMKPSTMRRQLLVLSFITVVFGLGVTFMVTNNLLAQQAFVEYRNYPGGPASYMYAMFSDTVGFTNNVTWVFSNCILDAFLVWRFVVVFNGISTAWFRVLVAVPCVIWAASVGIAIAALYKMYMANGGPDSTPFVTENLVLSYYSISTATNILLTFLIAGRILIHWYYVQDVLGTHRAGIYAGIATILIESALLYSAFAIPFLILFGIQTPVSNIFLNVVNSVQAISSMLIIYRVALGREWTRETSTVVLAGDLELKQGTSIAFASNTSAEGTESMSNSNKDNGDGVV